MKKLLCLCLIAMLILGTGTAAFADTSVPVAAAESTITSVTAAEFTVTGTDDTEPLDKPTKLSLEDAYKKILTHSPGAQMAELNKQSAYGVALGYGESVQNMDKIEDYIDNMDSNAKATSPVYWTYDSSNKAMLKVNRDYAASQGPRNFEAEQNRLKTATLKNYYTFKELETQEKIAEENLNLKEKLLANTQLKYKLGTVAKNDVLKAEIAVNEAQNQLTAAGNSLRTMKMVFNQFMGYGLMQNVILTDSIQELPFPSKSLEASIADALVNRNEVSAAAYNLNMAYLDFKNYKAYPTNSSKYIKAKMAVLMAETNSQNTPLNVEIDVRNKYMSMYQNYTSIQTVKKNVDNAKETVRLVQLQYDAGMATLTDVEEAQLTYYNVQIAYSRVLLGYNLAVEEYDLSSGVGTDTAAIR